MFSRQRGAALLILALIIGFVTAALLFNRFSVRNLELEREAKTTAALAEAKAALLGFAVSFGAEPGYTGHAFLPCTETQLTFNNEGSAEGNCGSTHVNSIGRLPWRSLKSPALRDGEKECLWYAVSGSYKNSGSSAPKMLNADSPGQFEIVTQDGTLLAGNTPENRAVGVIFSPGGITGAQNRAPLQGTDSCPGNYNAANYLETLNGVNNAFVNSNPDRIDRFILANKTGTFNDKLVFITQDEVFGKLVAHPTFLPRMQVLTAKIANCLAANYETMQPANLVLGDYRKDDDYVSAGTLARGRIPKSVTNCLSASELPLWKNWKDHFFYVRCATSCTVNGGGSYDAIVFFAGKRLARQTRRAPPIEAVDTKSEIGNYLEGCNASNFANGTSFQSQAGILNCANEAEINDRLYCIAAGSPRTVAPC